MCRPDSPIFAIWLACFAAASWAQTTFAQDVRTFDYVSLALAATAGFAAGAARTVLTMLSSARLVGDARMLLLKELAVSSLSGGAVYLCVQGWNALAEAPFFGITLPTVPRELRFVLVLAAGFMRGGVFGLLDKFAGDAIMRARKTIRGGAAENDQPITETLPLK